jgi:hypothetical protein
LREDAALDAVKRDYISQLDAEQRADLDKKLEAVRRSVAESLGGAYAHVARVEGQSVSVAALSDARSSFSEHLKLIWEQVLDEEWVLRKVGPVTLQSAGLVPVDGGIRIKDAVEAFLRYTDKPMVASRDAVIEGLKQACKEKLIGVARGASLTNVQRKWCGEDVSIDPNEEGLWIIPPFQPEQEPRPTPGEPVQPTVTSTGTTSVKPRSSESIEPGRAATISKGVRNIKIKGAVGLDSWSDIFRCFVSPAARLNPKKLSLGIDFEIETQEGQVLDENDTTLKAMREAARQLGLEIDEG